MGLNDYIKIGDNIKRIRKLKGISQKTMAEDILKIPRSTYSNYENNNRVPDNDMIKKIAKALDTSIGKIIGIEESELNDIFDFTREIGMPLEGLIGEIGEKTIYKYSLEKLLDSISSKEIIKKINEYDEELQNSISYLLYQGILNLFDNSILENKKYIDILYLETYFSELSAKLQIDLCSLDKGSDDYINSLMKIKNNFTNDISSIFDKLLVRCTSSEDKVLFHDEIINYCNRNKVTIEMQLDK